MIDGRGSNLVGRLAAVSYGLGANCTTTTGSINEVYSYHAAGALMKNGRSWSGKVLHKSPIWMRR